MRLQSTFNKSVPTEKEKEVSYWWRWRGMGGWGGGVWDSSEKAFNMITAGTDTGKERRLGVAGEEERGVAKACQYR